MYYYFRPAHKFHIKAAKVTVLLELEMGLLFVFSNCIVAVVLLHN